MQRIKAMELLDLLGYDVAGWSTNDLYQQLYELGYDWDGEEWVEA